MTKPVESLIEAFCDALKPEARYDHFIHSAEADGYPQVAKMFRAVVASEAIRERLLRHSLPNHAHQSANYFVCTHCGLIYAAEPPELCPVDQTPAERFLPIS